MTTLSVVPDNLEKYGSLLTRVSDDAEEAQSYADDHSADFGGISGRIWSSIIPSHDDAIEATKRMLKHLKTIGEESNKSLGETANYYRMTEEKIAAKVDASYPTRSPALSPQELTLSHYQEMTGQALATQNFTDIKDPRSALKEPESVELDAFAKFVSNPGGAFDYLSPSNAACKLIELIIHHDPIEWLTEWFSGDWKKCYECGDALQNVGMMTELVAANTLRGANELRETWMGNAADAAWTYFEGLSTAMGEQKEVLDQLGQKYKMTAMGICRLQETAVGIYKGMIDAALVAMAAGSAGVATSETGVGAAIGGLVAGVEAARIWEMWERLKMIPEKATQVGNSFVGFAQSATSKTAHFAQHPLPAAGYKSPMA
jgi:hypothetical protein